MSYDKGFKKKRRRTRPFPIFLIVIFLALVSFLYPHYQWERQPWHELSVFVIDKTVPNDGYRKHRGLMWVLNHFKVRQRGSTEPFDEAKDYFGFVPLPNHQ